MFTITIPHSDKGVKAIILKTDNRNYARIFRMLGNENKLDIKVTEEREPRVVKFKNVP